MKLLVSGRSRLTLVLVVMLAMLTAGSIRADEADGFPFDRFSITAGSFYETTDADLRVDAGTVNLGTPINLSQDLGLDDSDQLLRFEIEWRPFQRSQFSASYFDLKTEGHRTLDHEIHFGDTVFPVRASLDSELEVQFAELHYTFWAVKRPRGGIGLSLGAAALSIDTSLSAQLERPLTPGGSLRRDASASTDLPIPLLGAEGRYALGSHFMIAANARYLPELQIEQYSGSALSYGANLEYRFVRHLGLGVAWNSFNIDADVEKDRLRGSVDFTIEGAQLYLKVAM
jgi:hypothetical protein